MPTYSPSRLTAAALVLGAGWGCFEQPFDSGAVLFPEISSAARRQNCIRGAVLAPSEIHGTLDTRDCHVGPGLGYVDAYRFRVSDTLTTTVEVRGAAGVASGLDTQLDLFRVDDLDDYTASKVLLAHDDDSGGGAAPLVTLPLLPLTEYLIVVTGKDDFSLGGYRLRAN